VTFSIGYVFLPQHYSKSKSLQDCPTVISLCIAPFSGNTYNLVSPEQQDLIPILHPYPDRVISGKSDIWRYRVSNENSNSDIMLHQILDEMKGQSKQLKNISTVATLFAVLVVLYYVFMFYNFVRYL
jgi:hypothetical protein